MAEAAAAAADEQDQQTYTATSPDGREHVCLTQLPLDVLASLARVKDPSAGAVVMFAGTTRNTFNDTPVAHLAYTAYTSLAIKTLASIASSVRAAHELIAISITHRLGTVPVGDESILVCVSAAHRGPAWRAGEQALEEVKRRVEVWKKEVFESGRVVVGRDGEEGVVVDEARNEGEVGVWRANEERSVEGRLTGAQLLSGDEIREDGVHEDTVSQEDEGQRNGYGHDRRHDDEGFGHEDTQDTHEEHTYADDDGERRRIAEESRREMEMEMEKGWGGA